MNKWSYKKLNPHDWCPVSELSKRTMEVVWREQYWYQLFSQVLGEAACVNSNQCGKTVHMYIVVTLKGLFCKNWFFFLLKREVDISFEQLQLIIIIMVCFSPTRFGTYCK